MYSQIIVLLVLVGTASIHSLPIARRSASTTDSSSTVTIPRSVLEMLIKVEGAPKGLYPMYLAADFLSSKDELFKPEYQRLERKVCTGQVFISTSTTCNDSNKASNLTYSQLVDYYNELVLHLRLAEHNLQTAIDLEIKEANRSESLEKERKIIRLLNETILPALEFTLNISRTNCSMTTLLADWMISFSSNCVAVQSSNKLLAQTSLRLFDILDIDLDEQTAEEVAITVKGRKEWCIVHNFSN